MDKVSNFDAFCDCLSGPVIQSLIVERPKSRERIPRRDKNIAKSTSQSNEADKTRAADEFKEFIDYVAKEIFAVLPADLQIFSYTALQDDPHLGDRFGDPISMTIIENLCSIIPVSVTDSLETYGILPSQSDLQGFLTPVLQEYVNTVAAPPPVWSSTRASACEICERSWVPLTYHHLVPKQIHAKALKRKWHPQWRLNSVAWLCRACHSFVHRVANNEELAKDYWTIDKLTERDDVISWSQWVGRIRWKPR